MEMMTRQEAPTSVPRSSVTVSIETISGEAAAARDDVVAVEEPLEIRVAFGPPGQRTTKSLSVTMRTPGHDDELAAGFLWTEGIITDLDHFLRVRHRGLPAADGAA